MSIKASQIVSVTPRVISAGANELEIAGMILTENPLAVFPGTMAFANADAVADYFGADSAEYEAAQKYFLGYDNSFRKPRTLHFARMVTDAIAGALIGGSAADMDTLKAIANGSLTVTIDGSAKSLSTLDFSTATTQSDIAEKLQTALTGTTVTYNSNLNAFIITSGTTGGTSSVSVATGESADALGLSASAGATVSAGSTALTPAQLMQSITDVSQNWVSFTTLTEAEDDTVEALAEWTNGTSGEYLYVPWTLDQSNTNPNSSGSLTDNLTQASYEGVMLIYGELEKAILALSIGACIDWNRNNGLVTYAFKSQSGMGPSVTDDTMAANCVSLNVNYYGKWATRNDDFIFLYQGAMIGGNFGFADAYIGNLWLRNALQASIMSGITSVGRTSYTDEGYTLIRAWCKDPINRALVNGTIEAGVQLSESQKAQLMNEIGEDVSNQIFTDGYYLLIQDPGASVRVNRDSPTLGLWYTYGGSVHRIELPVTAVL